MKVKVVCIGNSSVVKIYIIRLIVYIGSYNVYLNDTRISYTQL